MLSAAKGGQIILFAAGGYFIGAHLSGKRHSSLLLNCIAVSILLSIGFGVHKYITLEPDTRFHLQGGFTDWNYYSIYLLCVSPIILYMTQKTKNAKQEIVFTSVLITLAILDNPYRIAYWIVTVWMPVDPIDCNGFYPL